MRLVRIITEVHAASQRPGIVGDTTSTVVLPGAGLPLIQRADRGWSVGQKEVELRLREEKGVAIFLEPAATTAQGADGTSQCNVGFQSGVNRMQVVAIR